MPKVAEVSDQLPQPLEQARDGHLNWVIDHFQLDCHDHCIPGISWVSQHHVHRGSRNRFALHGYKLSLDINLLSHIYCHVLLLYWLHTVSADEIQAKAKYRSRASCDLLNDVHNTILNEPPALQAILWNNIWIQLQIQEGCTLFGSAGLTGHINWSVWRVGARCTVCRFDNLNVCRLENLKLSFDSLSTGAAVQAHHYLLEAGQCMKQLTKLDLGNATDAKDMIIGGHAFMMPLSLKRMIELKIG